MEYIKCACGCGKKRLKHDKKGREAKYIVGHNFKGIILTENHKQKISQALRGKPKSEEHRKHLSEIKLKGLKISHGYVLIYKPEHPNHDNKGYVPEHRLVMEKHLDRYLKRSEDVHHKNENKQDNRIQNLQLTPNRSKHRLVHIDENRKINILTRKCCECGSQTTGLKNKNTGHRPTYDWHINFITGKGWWCNRCYNRYNMRRWRATRKQ